MSVTARSASPRKRPAQRRSAATVERILDSAARIFDERGYHGTTTNHIAEAAGVSVGSLYQYFPNKDSLLVALAQCHLAEAATAFGARLADLAARQPSIEEVTRSLVDLALERNDSTQLHALLFTDAPRTPELVAQFEALTSAVIVELTRHLERTGAGGPMPERRAAMLVAAVDAAVHHAVQRCPQGPTRRAAIDDLIVWVLGGVAPIGVAPGDVVPGRAAPAAAQSVRRKRSG